MTRHYHADKTFIGLTWRDGRYWRAENRWGEQHGPPFGDEAAAVRWLTAEYERFRWCREDAA